MFQTSQRSEQIKKGTDSKADSKSSKGINVADMMKGHESVASLGQQPAQRMVAEEREEEKPRQAKVIQKKSEPSSAKASERSSFAKASEDKGNGAKSSSGTKSGLSGNLKTKMEGSFGADFSDVNICKDSDNATKMGAMAYTQGNDVHFAPGQFNSESTSGQELIGHELAHVVQQRQGRVKTTKEMGKGMSINDSPALESEADEMGRKASLGYKALVNGNYLGGGVQKKKSEDVVYYYFVEKNKGNATIANMFGVSQNALEDANVELHKKRGAKGYFYPNDKIIIPSPTENLEKLMTDNSNGEEANVNYLDIDSLIKAYKDKKIDMPELARRTKQFALKKDKDVFKIYNELGWSEVDNFSYAFTANSQDTELAAYDKELLKKMSSTLGSILTTAPIENMNKKIRVDKFLNVHYDNNGKGLQKILSNDKEGKEGKEKVKLIINFIRNQLKVYPPKIKAFKIQDNYSDDQKLKIMGKIASIVARLEILMGTIFYEGSNTKQTWETKGKNKGDDEFLGYYQKEQHAIDKQGGEWCAMFVASVLNEALGFAPVDDEGNRSAVKGHRWLTWNVTSLHDSVTNHTGCANVKHDTRHEKKITNEQFNILRKNIVAEKDKKKKYKLVKDFFKSHFMPQSGDLLAVGAKTAEGVGKATKGLVGFNHSTMIENVIDKPDKDKIYFSTVEGNADQRAGGRLIDLTVSTNKSYNDLSFVTQVSRVSLKNYGIGTNINDGTKDALLKADSSKKWTAKDLISPLLQMSRLLQDYAAQKQYIQHGDYSNSIAELMQKDVAGSIH